MDAGDRITMDVNVDTGGTTVAVEQGSAILKTHNVTIEMDAGDKIEAQTTETETTTYNRNRLQQLQKLQ